MHDDLISSMDMTTVTVPMLMPTSVTVVWAGGGGEGAASQFQTAAAAELSRVAGGAGGDHHVRHQRPVAALLCLHLERVSQGQYCGRATPTQS